MAKKLLLITHPADQEWSGVQSSYYVYNGQLMAVLLHCTNGTKLVQYEENKLQQKKIEKMMDTDPKDYFKHWGILR